MYNDTVTLFCQYEDKAGVTWYPHKLTNVNLAVDRAAIIAKYGEQSQDNATLNVGYTVEAGAITVCGIPWLPPKEWAKQEPGERATSLTFSAGNGFGVLMEGEWINGDPVDDSKYGVDGFYNWLNRTADNVFAITAATKYDVIPHFEIIGK